MMCSLPPAHLPAQLGLAEVIRAYEPQARLPDAEGDLQRLYDQVLKDRRAIVFLNDASGVKQVEPLLPRSGCLTLVTSRRRFSLPNLHRLDLDALTPEAARELLLSLAPRLGDEADRVAELLGQLPLALRLAGGAFAERPDLEPDEYARKLESRDERVGLVEAAIDFNYRTLDAELQQRWRALAVFPGSFDAEGAAAVWDLAVDAAKDVLGGALYPVSLVEWRGGRYRLHDLAKEFAASRLGSEDQEVAARRHAGHYVEVLRETDRLYQEGGVRLDEGLALFDREWSNFRAGQAWAATKDDDLEAAKYSTAYMDAVYCLTLRLHPDDWIQWLVAGRTAAAVLGDRRGESNALLCLGIAYTNLGKIDKAIGFFEQALFVNREIGDRCNEASALRNPRPGLRHSGGRLSNRILQAGTDNRPRDRRPARRGCRTGNPRPSLHRPGKAHTAIGYYKQALVINHEIGDRRGQADDLRNLALTYVALEEADKAISYGEQDPAHRSRDR